MTNDRPRPTRTAAMLFVLVAVVCAVFGPSVVTGDFVWDDIPLIKRNTNLQGPGSFLRNLTVDFWDTSEHIEAQGGYWRPLVKVSHVLGRVVSEKAWPFRLFNVLLHAACTVMVFLIVRARSLAPLERGSWHALLAALVFALHPSRYESVGWISCSTELLFALGVFCALIAIEREHTGGVILGLLVAAASKETAVVLPVLFMADALLRRRRRDLARIGLGAAVLGLVFVARFAFKLPLPNSVDAIEPTARWPRVLASLGAYAWRTLAPSEATMVPFSIPMSGPGDFELPGRLVVLGVVVAVVASAVFVSQVAAGRREYGSVLVWWSLPLLPVLQVVALPTWLLVSDRFLYLPVFGLSLAVGAVGAQLRTSTARMAALALGGVLVFWAALLAWAMPSYESNLALFRREHKLWPTNALISDNLGKALAAAGLFDAERVVLTRQLQHERNERYRLTLAIRLLANEARLLRVCDADALQVLAQSLARVSSLGVNERLHLSLPDGLSVEADGAVVARMRASLAADLLLEATALVALKQGAIDQATGVATTLVERNPSAENRLLLARLLLLSSDQAAPLRMGPFDPGTSKALESLSLMRNGANRHQALVELGGAAIALRELSTPPSVVDDVDRRVQVLLFAECTEASLKEIDTWAFRWPALKEGREDVLLVAARREERRRAERLLLEAE